MNMALETLQQIGQQLDSGVFPCVHNGGFVRPLKSAIALIRGEETEDERQRPRRSATRSREWSASGQGSSCGQGTRGSWPAGYTSPLIRPDIQQQYREKLSEVRDTYPKTLAWPLDEGMLLLVESALIHDLGRSALFLVVVPHDPRKRVTSWGFWGSLALPGHWIGPRHTNVPDGSICAFDPRDGTWQHGGSWVTLLDLYSLWAVRHLYMEHYQRWPGYQSAHHTFERIIELRPDEYCGCPHSNKLYEDCCQSKDQNTSQLTAAIHYANSGFGSRLPPACVNDFLLHRKDPEIVLSVSGV